MKKFFLFFILTILPYLISEETSAQKIYRVDYESQADFKVYVVSYESQADLRVYKVDYEFTGKQRRSLV